MANATSTRCPFNPCTSVVDLLPMKGLDLGTPPVVLIREHSLDPDSWFGLCPASNLSWPLSADERDALVEHARILGRMRESRAAAADKAPRAQPLGQHSLWPRPDPEGSHQMGLRPAPKPKKRPPLRVIEKGDRMPSVAETLAAISRANEQIAEAQEATRLATIKWEDARSTLLWIRQNTVDPLGLPMVSQAIEACETAQQLGTPAIEANVTYGSGM